MREYHTKVEDFVSFDKIYTEVEEILQNQNNLTEDIIKRFHLKMWMFTHGIACLIATNTCEFSEGEISTLLTEEFHALIKEVTHRV